MCIILKILRKVRPLLSQTTTETINHVFRTCRIDCCIVSSLPKKNITALQLLQNSTCADEDQNLAHITPILKSLHWLPVYFRIDFKILLLVFKALNGLIPYLSNEPSRSLGSSDRGLFLIPKVRTETQGDAASDFYNSWLQNSLPGDQRTAEILTS